MYKHLTKDQLHLIYLLWMSLGDAVELFVPVWTTEVSLALQPSDGVTVISLLKHDSKRLTVLPTSRQVDVRVQEVTKQNKEQCITHRDSAVTVTLKHQKHYLAYNIMHSSNCSGYCVLITYHTCSGANLIPLPVICDSTEFRRSANHSNALGSGQIQ